jgi:hypothetical protein
VSYGHDMEIEYDDGDIEMEAEDHESRRGAFGERGQQLLQDLDRTHVLDYLGR